MLDLETTGGSPADDVITEIGAIKVRGGECLGTVQTFVHPGRSIPAFVTHLTGITDAMVSVAPRPEAVLPTFHEFVRGCVIVGHNVRFDLGFLDRAFDRLGYGPLTAPVVDTCSLARRLVRDEVPDCRLGTLADRLRLDHRPTHRALADALATADLLHVLLERAAAYGVFRLDDLLTLPKLAGHPLAAKLRLTDPLPRTPGVYEFLDRDRSVIYLGKATNLRQRVRSYFGSDDRRTIRPMLTQLHEIRHRPTSNSLLAELTELRLLHTGRPRFNRAGALPTKPVWLQLTDEPFARFTTSAKPQPAATALGPFASVAAARRAQEAIETVVPVRRCTARVRAVGPAQEEPCTPARLGVAHCPCAGTIDARRYAWVAAGARRALTEDASGVLQSLELRMRSLAAAQRFEEAALVRDRAAALAAAVRARAIAAVFLTRGAVTLEIGSRRLFVVAGIASCFEEPLPVPVVLDAVPPGALTPAVLAETAVLARWLTRYPDRWRIVGEEQAPFLAELEAARAPAWPVTDRAFAQAPTVTSSTVTSSTVTPSAAMPSTITCPSGGNAAASPAAVLVSVRNAAVGPDPESHAAQAPAARPSLIA